jgi:hypothetical protein
MDILKPAQFFALSYLFAIAIGVFSSGSVLSQSIPVESATPQDWTSMTQTDALTGQSYAEFELPGRFLDPPADGTITAPKIELRCDPAPYRRLSGRFMAGFIVVGTVIDPKNGNATTMQFRLDDGKPQYWQEASYSTDYQAIAFDSLFLNNILWGHILPHKPGSGGPIRKLVVAVQEHLGGRIVMQFDMPDPAVVSRVCGAEYK